MTGHSCLNDLSERESAFMSETTPVLLGMSGSLRTGSYSNAVLETLREKFAGRADLQLYDLAPIPLYNQDFEGEKRPPGPVVRLMTTSVPLDRIRSTTSA